MKFKVLGRTGVQVSELCFGTMSFGADADRAESARMYAACRDRGINFFDCANVYSRGRAEEILGELIAGDRDELVITSKCAMPTGDNVQLLYRLIGFKQRFRLTVSMSPVRRWFARGCVTRTLAKLATRSRLLRHTAFAFRCNRESSVLINALTCCRLWCEVLARKNRRLQ